MRFFLTLLLAVLIPLNAAYAAVVGVCDALEHTQSHSGHFGHHEHDSRDHKHGDPHEASSADPGQSPSACDHVHSGFATLLSTTASIMLPAHRSPYLIVIRHDFVSAPLIGLERPPRTRPVA